MKKLLLLCLSLPILNAQAASIIMSKSLTINYEVSNDGSKISNSNYTSYSTHSHVINFDILEKNEDGQFIYEKNLPYSSIHKNKANGTDSIEEQKLMNYLNAGLHSGFSSTKIGMDGDYSDLNDLIDDSVENYLQEHEKSILSIFDYRSEFYQYGDYKITHQLKVGEETCEKSRKNNIFKRILKKNKLICQVEIEVQTFFEFETKFSK